MANRADLIRYGIRTGVYVPPVLSISGTPVTTAVEDTVYSGFTVTASNGVPPYVYSVYSGSLPSGISLNSATGLVSGTPTDPGTASNIVIRVTDAALTTADLAAFTLTVSAASAADYIATSAAQLITHMNSAIAAGGNKVIQLSDAGSFGTTIINLTDKDPASRVTIRSQSVWGVTTPGFDLDRSSNITIKDTKCQRNRVVSGTAADITAGIIRTNDTVDVWIDNCRISADPMTTIDLRGYMAVSGGNGVDFIDGEAVVTSHTVPGTGVYRDDAPASSPTNFCITGPTSIGNASGGVYSSAWSGKTLTGTVSGGTRTIGAITSNGNYLVGVVSQGGNPSTGLKVINCEISDVKWGVAASGTNMEISGNYIHDFYISPFDFNSNVSGLRVIANRCWGGWAESTDGEPSGTNGPHSSVGGFSFGDTMPNDIIIQGNMQLIGTARYDFMGEQAQGTGSKVNDMECTKVGSISGTTLTVTSNVLLPTFKAKVGSRVIGPGVPDNTVIEEVLTGSGLNGTYRLNNSATVPGGTTLYVQGRVYNMKYRNNIIDTNASIGTQISYMGAGCEYAYNTHISTRDTNSGTTPSFYISDCDSGVSVHHNVVLAMAKGGVNRYINPDVYRDSSDNVTILRTATTGPAAYESVFDGIGGPTPFSRATVSNVLQMFNPKAGSRIADGAHGHTAYYNWNTRETSYPTFVGPRTSISTGVDLPAVNFDGTNDYTLYTAQGSEGLLDFSNGNAITVVMGVRYKSSNASDTYLMRSQNSDILVRRLPSAGNALSISLRGADGNNSVNVTSTLGLNLSDTDVTLIAFSVDFANYKFHLVKGTTPDNLALITGWSGQPLRVTSDVTGFMASESTSGTTSRTSGDVTFCYVHNGYLDLTLSANWDKLVALDGKPVDYGADGSSLLGVQPKVYLKGVASAWNNVAGLNLGSGARKFIMGAGASVTDV